MEKENIKDYNPYSNYYYANTYRELYGKEQREKYKVLTNLIDKKEITILDIGSGTGELFSFLQESGTIKRAVAIEPSPYMLKILKERKEKIGKNIIIIEKRAEDSLKEIKETFFLVTAFTSLHHISDIKYVIKRMFDLSKRYVVISMLRPSKKYEELLSILEKYKEFLIIKKDIRKDTVFVFDKEKFKKHEDF